MKHWQWWAWIGALVSAPAWAAGPVEILAIGASQTNGHGVPPDATYPAHLQALLHADGFDVTVRNEGIDGGTAFKVYQRLIRGGVTEQTKLVVLEQSSNDNDPSSSIEYTSKALGWLQERHLPTVLISSGRVQPDENAERLAAEFGAVYYGTMFNHIPRDSEHVQQGESFAGKNKIDYQLTSAGYGAMSKVLLPTIEKLLAANHLASAGTATP